MQKMSKFGHNEKSTGLKERNHEHRGTSPEFNEVLW